MKKHPYYPQLRTSLAALAIGASGFFTYHFLSQPEESTSKATEKNRHTARNAAARISHRAENPSHASTTADPNEIPPSHVIPCLFQEFNDWAVTYSKASPAEQQQMLARGETMVKQRHEQMAGLIEQNPKVALAEADALPPLARQALPESLKQQLEQPVNARGDLAVVAYLGKDIAPYKRFATLEGEEYTVYPEGENESVMREPNRSLLGIRLSVNRVTKTDDGKTSPRVDRVMALRKDRIRVLSKDEVTVAVRSLKKGAEPACDVSAKSVTLNKTPAAIETGGDTKWMCQPEHATAWLKTQAGILAARLPNGVYAAGGPGEGAGPDYRAVPDGWSTGNKSFLCVRFRCQDQPTTLYNGLDTSLSGMFSELNQWSYGRINFNSYTLSPLLVLPHTFSDYALGKYNAQNDAWSIAEQNYTLSNFSFSAVCVSDLWPFLGSASIVDSKMQINEPSNRVFQHEIGHCLGLPHANSWIPTTSDPIGPGSHGEYGGAYDTMGYGRSTYNTMNRFYIRWLTMSETHDLASRTDGTYTIYDPDVTSLTPGRKHTIRVPRSDGTYYFVEFRPRPTALTDNGGVNSITQNGIRILRTNGAELIDVTPLSADGANDAALVVGKQFHDAGENITIRAVAKGGSGADQYFKVQVSFSSGTVTSGHAYALRSKDYNYLTGVINYSGDNGGTIAQQTPEGYANQKWILMKVDASNYKIVNMNSGKIMEVGGNSTANQATVQQWDYVGTPSQKWQIIPTSGGYFKIINAGSGLALSIPFPLSQTGIQLQQYTYLNASNQQWAFDEVNPLTDGGNYAITSRNSGKILDLAGGGNADGANVQQWSWYGLQSQKWTSTTLGGALQILRNKNSGKVLESTGYATNDGGNICQWTWVGHNWQKWTVEAVDQDAGGFWYKIVNVGSGKVADVSGVSTSDGANVHQWGYWGGRNQQWRFTAVP
jgi:Ricin-type beta-trefoil lectin domain-like